MSDPRTNWAGNIHYRATALHEPASLEELQALVARSSRLKVIASRHSFNGIGDTAAEQVSLARLNRIVALDRAARTVTIEAGMRYGELGAQLHREGFALPNLASLPHISVAGAVATATHGSGNSLGNLATAVTALELVTADGRLVTLSRAANPEEFPGAVVNLGALGIVSKLTLALEPTYDVRQVLFENLAWAEAAEHFHVITSSATSVSLFTDWQSSRFHQVWLKQRTDRPHGSPTSGNTFFGAVPATVDQHPLPGHPAANCTPQLGVGGPWHERLPHFRLEFTPSSGAELQSEYFVSRHHGPAALRVLAPLRPLIGPHVHVTEIRTIAEDDLWLSPCHEQSRVGIHFTWKPDWPAVKQVLPHIERVLAPYDVRPHWGKLFMIAPPELGPRYRRFEDFRMLQTRLDPTGKFRNEFLDSLLGTP